MASDNDFGFTRPQAVVLKLPAERIAAKDATRDLAIFKESLSFVAGGSRGHQ